MHITIRQLYLFPIDRARCVRSLTFEPGMVNVITGTSGRGKSAIIHIIDYCFGAEKCMIPVGPIRNTVAWYGMLFDIDGEFIFIARREPGTQQSSEDYDLRMGPDISIPTQPERTTTRSAFKAKMNEFAGLPNLDLRAGEPKGFDGRASFRDMAAFNFLPQHIVANPQTLFFKTDTTEHRERLRRVFPLALGAVDAAYLRAEHEERDIQRQLQAAEEQLRKRGKADEVWLAELRGMVARATEYGLIPRELLRLEKLQDVVRLLSSMVTDSRTANRSLIETGNTEGAVARVTEILESEGKIARDIATLRRRLQRIERMGRSANAYGTQLDVQSNRLGSIGWFRETIANKTACPFCGVSSNSADQEVAKLKEAAIELEQAIDAVKQRPVLFEREQVKMAAEVRQLEQQLQDLRRERRELEDTSAEGSRRTRSIEDMFMFLGRVEQVLLTMDETSIDGALTQNIDRLKQDLDALRGTLNPELREERLNIAIEKIGRLIAISADQLNLERKDDIHRLVPSELALIFRTQSGRSDYLWELGSGENWMGYHIATLLALHEHFLSTERSPVATFLVIDQPSQVYFPARNDSYDREIKATSTAELEGGQPAYERGDLLRTRRIFETLSAAIKRMEGKFQVIVMEHADELTWGGVPLTHMVENWRDENFLVPLDWLPAAAPATTSGDGPNNASA